MLILNFDLNEIKRKKPNQKQKYKWEKPLKIKMKDLKHYEEQFWFIRLVP